MTSATSALEATIAAYFDGERRELLALVTWSLAVGAVAAATIARPGVGRGLGASLFALALLGLASAIPLLVRDAAHRDVLATQVQGGAAAAARQREVVRMRDVVARYPAYRVAYVALLVVALGLAVSRRPLLLGVAVGLAITAGTGLVVDRASEHRARAYLRALEGG